MSVSTQTKPEHDAWNPGISSRIPASLQPSVTLFRPENSTVDYRHACELSDFCGLEAVELISLRVERLVVHELLVRVTSDLSVPDGPNYEDLGISLRSMVSKLYQSHAHKALPHLQLSFDRERLLLHDFIAARVQEDLFPANTAVESADSKKPSLLYRLFKGAGKKNVANSKTVSDEPREVTALARWNKQLSGCVTGLEEEALKALIKVLNAMVATRGQVLNQPELIVTIATNIACNHTGAKLIASLLEPLFQQGVEELDYRFLPVQQKPVVMNVKGASASGKSTIRPQQRQLADKLGIPWEDFALISPDYWRKYLLDYDSLGDDYKYAAMLTGQELEIVDRKLDGYMAEKAARGEVTHLLIDRFRFDSFDIDNGGHSRDTRLLSRFGDRIFLFFMITPPAETVVRAWARGKTTGRYKAVDDLLYHNVEAYTGMPALFLSWVLSDDKQVHFEFLDNSVQKGQVPRTVAFGCNHCMTVVDAGLLRCIDRYQHVNVAAVTAETVLSNDDQSQHGDFLRHCLTKISQVMFVDKESGNTYAQVCDGVLARWDRDLTLAQTDSEFLMALFTDLSKPQKENLSEGSAAANGAKPLQYKYGQYTLGQ